jgi:large subunit ribosomal protein L3
MFSSIRKLQTLACRQFSRLQTSNKSETRVSKREVTKKDAQSDDKFIKLSKKDESSAKANEELIERTSRMAGAKLHDLKIDQKFAVTTRRALKEKIASTKVDLIENPLQTYDLYREAMKETLKDREQVYQEQSKLNKEIFEKLDVRNYDGKSWRKVKQEKAFFNAEEIVNEKFHIQPVEEPKPMSRRSGVLGYKVGMTSAYDKWGHMIPLTVLQIDRCQVIRSKTVTQDGYDSLLLGCGEKSLNTLTKPMLGVFLQANVPPKLNLAEFRISPENALPVGYMLGVRHFNIGQYVDVKAKSKGKGFSGVMKRWNFDGQPASHGCSVSHRMPGSTGQRQDPGRVFKGKKMAGRLGNENITVRRLLVYKIDFERSLLFIKGSVPGPMHRLIEISDAYYHWQDNIGKLNYPTFVYQQGKTYANVMQVEPAEQDPTEDWLHENAILSDDEEEGAGVTSS